MEIELGANTVTVTVTVYLELILLAYFFQSSISLEIPPLSAQPHRWMGISRTGRRYFRQLGCIIISLQHIESIVITL